MSKPSLGLAKPRLHGRRPFFRSDRGSPCQVAPCARRGPPQRALIRWTARTLSLVKSRLSDTYAASPTARIGLTPLAAASRDGAVRQPSPRARTEVRREHATALHRQMRGERAIDAQPRSENVVDHPVAFLEVQHRDVRLG